MSQTHALYRLQRLDLEIDGRRKRAHEIIDLLDQDSELREAQKAVTTLQTQLQPKETRVTDLNLELQTVADNVKQLSARLYDRSVSNPKELEDIKNKIDERQRRREKLEHDLLETMLEIDDLKSTLMDATAHLNIIKTERASDHDALKAEFKHLKDELETLKSERTTAAQAVTKQNRVLYKELRAKRQGQAVAPMKGDSCTVCGVSQTTTLAQQVRQDQNIVFCSSCGRILVAL